MKKSNIIIISILILSIFATVVSVSSSPVATPVVTILNPSNGETVGDIVTIGVNASSDVAITEYEIYIDSVKQTMTTFNTYYWNTSAETNGTHSIRARAKDANNNWGETTISVTVDTSYLTGTWKLLSYNILESGTRLKGWRDAIVEENPDVVVLSETGLWNSPDDELLVNDLNYIHSRMPADEEDYYAIPSKTDPTSTGGEALFSRFPIIEFNEINDLTLDDGTTHEAQHVVMHAVIEVGYTWISIIGIHLRCCDDSGAAENREMDMEGIINYIDSLGPVPVIYTGDFNSFHPEITDGNLGNGPISMLLNATNEHASVNHTWQDAYRELNPLPIPGYSYVDDIYESRIDFNIVNQFFFDKLINSTVASTPSGLIGSDHYPVNLWINMDPDQKDLRPPVYVYPVNASIVNDSTVDLNWGASQAEDFAKYKIYRNNTYIGESLTATYTDSSAPSMKLLNYQVTAVDENNNEARKSIPLYLNTSYGLIKTPEAPILTSEQSTENKAIILSWTPPKETGGVPIAYYKVYRGVDKGQEDIEYFYWESISATTYFDSRIAYGINYVYKVSAVNLVGEGVLSNHTAITPVQPTTTTTTEETKDTSVHPLFMIFGLLATPILLQVFQKRED